MLYFCRRYRSDINTDRPCVSRYRGVRTGDEGVQLRNVKKKRTNEIPKAKKLVGSSQAQDASSNCW
jgi:hypothetical protein